ncbi:MAG: PilZ domain-containing protein [Methyloligellaceae bacterium]
MNSGKERRVDRRHRVFLQADVCTLDGLRIGNCSIRDTSRTGCKIMSSDLDQIPDELVLSIRGLDETFVGRVMWRDADMAGIEFLNDVRD